VKLAQSLVVLVVLFPFLPDTPRLGAQSPDQYTVAVHVSSSRWSVEAALSNQPVQVLDVAIDGKKYELEGPTYQGSFRSGFPVLALGDYKAKIVQDEHKNTYETSQAYEILPDKKTRKYYVVAVFE
jgi:hypothetical protein